MSDIRSGRPALIMEHGPEAWRNDIVSETNGTAADRPEIEDVLRRLGRQLRE
jgi:hypothetical protein